MAMDQVGTLHVCRYWSEVLLLYHQDLPERPCCQRSLVIDFGRFSGKAQVRRATLSATALIF